MARADMAILPCKTDTFVLHVRLIAANAWRLIPIVEESSGVLLRILVGVSSRVLARHVLTGGNGKTRTDLIRASVIIRGIKSCPLEFFDAKVAVVDAQEPPVGGFFLRASGR